MNIINNLHSKLEGNKYYREKKNRAIVRMKTILIRKISQTGHAQKYAFSLESLCACQWEKKIFLAP